MFLTMMFCKTQEGTAVIAIGPAFNADLDEGREILIADFTDNIRKRATIVQAINIDSDSPAFQFILKSHTMMWDDLFEVTHVVDYKQVQSFLDK